MKLLLFSGGIDSTAIAWLERPDRLLFIDYGQCSAAGELRAAKAISHALKIPLDVRNAQLASFGRGTLIGESEIAAAVPEFWPFRNQMLVTLAVMTYSTDTPLEVLIGTVATDVIHTDGRGKFVEAMSALLEAQGDYRLRAPALNIDSVMLIRRSAIPAEILGWTFSCHTGEWACGQCRGCNKHNEIKIAQGMLGGSKAPPS